MAARALAEGLASVAVVAQHLVTIPWEAFALDCQQHAVSADSLAMSAPVFVDVVHDQKFGLRFLAARTSAPKGLEDFAPQLCSVPLVVDPFALGLGRRPSSVDTCTSKAFAPVAVVAENLKAVSGVPRVSDNPVDRPRPTREGFAVGGSIVLDMVNRKKIRMALGATRAGAAKGLENLKLQSELCRIFNRETLVPRELPPCTPRGGDPFRIGLLPSSRPHLGPVEQAVPVLFVVASVVGPVRFRILISHAKLAA